MRRVLLLHIIFLCSSVAFSQQSLSSHEIVKEVQKKYAPVKNISASFVQKRTLRFGNTVQQEQGTISVTSDNKYKIETETQLLVTDSKTVWVYSPLTKQVLIGGNKTSGFGFSLNKFLLGLPSDYSIALSAANDSFYVLQLHSVKKKDDPLMPAAFSVKIGKSDFLIYSVEFEDRNKTKTEILLSQISMNRQLPAAAFEFQIPGDATVVDTRKIK